MSDKVYINDFSILFISLSERFGLLEKRAIEDALFLRDIGGKPTIVCMKDSYLYKKAMNNDIPVIEYKKIVKRNFDFNYYFFIKKVLNEDSFDIVHCYGLKYFWMLSLALRKYNLVGLFVTLNQAYSSIYKKPLYQLLMRRVDTVFCFSDRLKELLADWLPIHKWKLKKIGAGVDFINIERSSSEINDIKKIGSIVPIDLSGPEQIDTLLNSFTPLLSSDYRVELYLYSEEPWEQMPSKQLIVDMLHSRGIDYKVFLKEKKSFNEVMKNLDIFIGISNEPLDLFLLHAMVRCVPVLVPRNGIAEDMWFKKNVPFETYYYDDARELKVKCLKILGNKSKYQEKLEKVSSKILGNHNFNEYVDTLSFHYNKVYLTRHKSMPNDQVNTQ